MTEPEETTIETTEAVKPKSQPPPPPIVPKPPPKEIILPHEIC